MTNGTDSVFHNERVVNAEGDSPKLYKCESLSKREYFAAMAMQMFNPQRYFSDQGFAGSYMSHRSVRIRHDEDLTTRAVQIADALIAALNEGAK